MRKSRHLTATDRRRTALLVAITRVGSEGVGGGVLCSSSCPSGPCTCAPPNARRRRSLTTPPECALSSTTSATWSRRKSRHRTCAGGCPTSPERGAAVEDDQQSVPGRPVVLRLACRRGRAGRVAGAQGRPAEGAGAGDSGPDDRGAAAVLATASDVRSFADVPGRRGDPAVARHRPAPLRAGRPGCRRRQLDRRRGVGDGQGPQAADGGVRQRDSEGASAATSGFAPGTRTASGPNCGSATGGGDRSTARRSTRC